MTQTMKERWQELEKRWKELGELMPYPEAVELLVLRREFGYNGVSKGEETRMDENTKLRRLLWLHHGCPVDMLYGDDGEMQCGYKHIIDFRRDSTDDIELKLMSEEGRQIIGAMNKETL